MFAVARHRKPKPASARQNELFVSLLPQIINQVEYAFRRVPPEARAEYVQEAVAHAYWMFLQLCRRRKTSIAFATPLAKFAIRHVREGRRIGSRFNLRDLTTTCGGPGSGNGLKRLDRFDCRTGEWRELVVEDWRSGPAEIATTRIDFADWLKTLSVRDRRLAEILALGESTGRAARMFRISAARVSQLRQEFFEGWHKFVGELADPPQPVLASV
jgi:hypothetical protein